MVSLKEQTQTGRITPTGDSAQLHPKHWTLHTCILQRKKGCVLNRKASFQFKLVWHSVVSEDFLCVFITVLLWILSSIQLILKQITGRQHNQLAGSKPCKHKVTFSVGVCTWWTFTEQFGWGHADHHLQLLNRFFQYILKMICELWTLCYCCEILEAVCVCLICYQC